MLLIRAVWTCFQDKSLPGKLESMSKERGHAVLQVLAQLSAVAVM